MSMSCSVNTIVNPRRATAPTTSSMIAARSSLPIPAVGSSSSSTFGSPASTIASSNRLRSPCASTPAPRSTSSPNPTSSSAPRTPSPPRPPAIWANSTFSRTDSPANSLAV